MWFVFLYSTLLPIGAIISVLGLFFYYWVDKYNLTKRSKVHGKVSGHFMRTSLRLLDLVLIFKPLGSIIFDTHLRDNYYMPSDIIMICIAFVYIIVPKTKLIKFFNYEYFRPEQKRYSEIKYRFEHENYYTHHPLFSALSDEIEDHR